MSAIHLKPLVLIAALGAAGPGLTATSGYAETWDTPGDLAGWFPNTVDSIVTNPGAGGNGGGFLETLRAGPFPIGAATDLAAATGSFAGQPWTAQVDLLGLGGASSDVWLRFRFQDATFNGWRYRLTDVLGDAWQTFSVGFDPGWTDAQAMANGWQTDLPGGFASVSWAETMGDVYTTEIRIDGNASLAAGIDNFMLAAVPEPSSYALLGAGLLCVGGLARRRMRGR